ncbi:hypothetical protein JCM9533A_80350 [Catenuloplanes niger JCM 9533]
MADRDDGPVSILAQPLHQLVRHVRLGVRVHLIRGRAVTAADPYSIDMENGVPGRERGLHI